MSANPPDSRARSAGDAAQATAPIAIAEKNVGLRRAKAAGHGSSNRAARRQAHPMTIDVIVNRKARRLSSDTPLRRALLAAAAHGHARIHETASLQDLDRVASQIAAHPTDGVVLAGGDGSHMGGVSALSRAFGGDPPPVALAPCGTVCTIARNLGMRGTSRAWTERVVRAACNGTARIERRMTLRVRDDGGGERVGFIFGAALVARFFEVYDAAPIQGLVTAAGIAARVFAGSFFGSPLALRILERTRCTVTVDGSRHGADEWSLLLASVLRDVGLHLRATYRAGESLDRFHVVASGLPPHALGPQLPRVLAGRSLSGQPHIDALARSLEVAHGTSRDAYVLDGDVFQARHIRVETGPVLRILMP